MNLWQEPMLREPNCDGRPLCARLESLQGRRVKRPDSLYPVRLRSPTEDQAGWGALVFDTRSGANPDAPRKLWGIIAGVDRALPSPSVSISGTRAG